ncbi:MAG: anti-sigma factor antagonist [Acidobacteria bacterium]|nr:MAG: anti-sigma factor antagonist [Acidobacteriota bacterium]
MGVKITTRSLGDVSVVDVCGRITLSGGSAELGETLRDIASKGGKKVLVNLGEVSYLDSSAIGELISGFTTITNRGGNLKLLSLNQRVMDLFRITKSNTIFEIHDDEAAAVRSFV